MLGVCDSDLFLSLTHTFFLKQCVFVTRLYCLLSKVCVCVCVCVYVWEKEKECA